MVGFPDGTNGKGDGPTGKALAAAGQPAPRDFTVGEFKFDTNKDGEVGTDADLAGVIKNGAAPYGGNPLSSAAGRAVLAAIDGESPATPRGRVRDDARTPAFTPSLSPPPLPPSLTW